MGDVVSEDSVADGLGVFFVVELGRMHAHHSHLHKGKKGKKGNRQKGTGNGKMERW